MYNVYAIGNALVDTEFSVENDFFAQMSDEKGLMTLIDQDRQSALWEKVNKAPVKKQCGGSAANTAIAISQLGGSSYYAFKVANDELGNFYCSDLENNKVQFKRFVDESEKAPTGACSVFITPDADRTMYTYLGATQNFGSDQLNSEALGAANYLYIEGYLVTSDSSFSAVKKSIEDARSKNKLISLTLSDPGIVGFFKEKFLEILNEKVELIFCNEEEAMSLSGTDNIHSAFESLKQFANRFAITRGAEGALIYDGSEKKFVEGYKVEAINTNGAGDLFAGAFLYGTNNGMSDESSAKLGNFLSSKLVQKFGARLESTEVQKYLKEFKG